MWLVGVVVRRYIDFLIILLLLFPTPLLFFAAASLLFVHLILIVQLSGIYGYVNKPHPQAIDLGFCYG